MASRLAWGGTALAALICVSVGGADAQTAGLLLGIAQDTSAADDMAPTTYQTLWIAPVNGRLAIAARQKGIVTPRADGWWRFDVAHGCEAQAGTALTKEELGTPAARQQWGLYRWEPAYPPDPACERAARAARQQQAAEGNEPCARHDVRIDYTGPRYLGVSTLDAEWDPCTSTPSLETRREVLNEGWKDEPFLEHVDDTTAATLASAWRAQADSTCIRQWDEFADQDWGFQRGKGAWQAVFRVYDLGNCGEREGPNPPEWGMATPLPASLMARDSAGAWRSRVEAAVPDATDYFVSPSADLIGVRTGALLRLYAPAGGRLGRPVLEVPLPAKWRVVMAEWALGRHVARWTAELSR